MDQNVLALAPARTSCPLCGRRHLTPAPTSQGVNLLCPTCGACWEPARHWLCRIDPAGCPGCPLVGFCAPEGTDGTPAAAG